MEMANARFKRCWPLNTTGAPLKIPEVCQKLLLSP